MMHPTPQRTSDFFVLVPVGQLSRKHFELHPVWSEYYDYDERDEIGQWGIDLGWFDQQLKKLDLGNEHCAYPVLILEPLPDRMRLFIKAIFSTLQGDQLAGYVVNENAYAITIFHGEEDFVFSSHPLLKEEVRQEAEKLQKALGVSDGIFPLHYYTEFRDRDGKRIEGVFNPSE